MYPQLFLRTFWQMQFKPQIFVAMSFDDKYKPRFDDIIAPAIRSIEVDGVSLEPHRVDISKSGDSILTDINDGIAHSQLVLADVSSSIGKDSITGQPYRNANVMYEVGLALACRQPTEILLVRDDHDKFLFDVSTIPHMSIDFTDEDLAIKTLKEKLEARIKERNYINDARVKLAIAKMIKQEIDFVRIIGNEPGARYVPKKEKQWDPHGVDQSARLLDKQILYFAGQTKDGYPIYRLTPLGRAVAEFLKK
jgi:hypothetical protein